MNVVYTGEIYRQFQGTSFQRMMALQDFGINVAPVCVVPFALWGGKLFGAPFRRLQMGPPVDRYNQELLKTVAHHQAQMVWVDKGVWVKAETVQKIKVLYGATVVHYTPDPALVFHKSRYFQKAVPHYDLIVTTKAYELNEYRQRGARELLLQMSSYDKRAHYPIQPTEEERKKYECDVSFVGNYAPGREKWLEPIAQLGVTLAIWGAGWERCKSTLLQPYIKYAPVLNRDYPLSVSCAKIGLGMLSPLVPDRSTTRSLEIPACGTFLLAERPEEHERLFEEGVEAEFFATEDELQHKVSYYLKHHEEREAIAKAGYQRCQNSDYSSHHKVLEILKTLQYRGIVPSDFLSSLPDEPHL